MWLSSATVRIGGILTPIFYVGQNQINVQVPFEVASGENKIVVSEGGADLMSNTITVRATAPGVFLSSPGQAAAINQDGSVNGPNHPAAVGSIVSVYVTGLGAVQPAIGTGTIASASVLSKVTASVTAQVGSEPAKVVFAGLSPGSAGLYQVNFVVPAVSAGEVNLEIQAGGVGSNVASISVQ